MGLLSLVSQRRTTRRHSSRDTVRNSISMAAQTHFSHKRLHGVSSAAMQELLYTEAGVNWNDYPDSCKRGRVTVLCSCAEPKRCHRCLLRGALGVIMAMGLLTPAAWAPPAQAEHEVQFRYTVLGYVKEVSGKPRKGVALEVTREKTGLSYPAETDASGLYVIVTRLADESLGERLLVRAGPRSLRIAAQFDPADHAAERGTRVDFTGDKATERPGLFRSTLNQFLSK